MPGRRTPIVILPSHTSAETCRRLVVAATTCVNASPTSGWKERVRAESYDLFIRRYIPEGSGVSVARCLPLNAFEARGHRHLEQAAGCCRSAWICSGSSRGSRTAVERYRREVDAACSENAGCAVFLGLCHAIGGEPRDRRTISRER